MAKEYKPKPTPENHKHLYAQVSRGELHAFDQFCRDIEPPLYSYLLRLVKQRPEAEDLAQETLLRVFQAAKAGRLRSMGTGPRAFAFTTAHNLAIDLFRRNSRTPPEPRAEEAPASNAAERSLLRDEIDKALAGLPANHASAILLREFGGLPYAEIAAIHGVSPGAVKTWIYRARRALAQVLDRDGQYIGDQRHGV